MLQKFEINLRAWIKGKSQYSFFKKQRIEHEIDGLQMGKVIDTRLLRS